MSAYLKGLAVLAGKALVLGLLIGGAMLALGLEDSTWAHWIGGYVTAGALSTQWRFKVAVRR